MSGIVSGSFTGTLGANASAQVEFGSSAAAFVRLTGPAASLNTNASGLYLGLTASEKVAFFGDTPTAQPAAVANASGGAVQDAEARTALNSLLAKLRTLGLIDT